jgi:hypothetical protein
MSMFAILQAILGLYLFSTAWTAATRLAAGLSLYARAVFVTVNIAFLGYQQEALSQASASEVSATTRALPGYGH